MLGQFNSGPSEKERTKEKDKHSVWSSLGLGPLVLSFLLFFPCIYNSCLSSALYRLVMVYISVLLFESSVLNFVTLSLSFS